MIRNYPDGPIGKLFINKNFDSGVIFSTSREQPIVIRASSFMHGCI